MAKESVISFKSSEPMEAALGKLGFDTDRSKSEILRACVCLGLPVLKSNPSLIYRLDWNEFQGNSKKD